MKLQHLLAGVVMSTFACTTGEVPTTVTTGYVPVPEVAGGEFAPLTGYANMSGDVFMVRSAANGTTELHIWVSGVPADKAHVAHVHTAACATGAAGHYKIDPNIPGAIESNELWLKATSSRLGTLVVGVDFAHLARGDARSVVVHDPASGAKMACADLTPM
jgi:hypothetical protein